MLTVDELRNLIGREIPPLPETRVTLGEALGLRLSRDVCADSDQPAFSRSAVDGFMLAAGSGPGRYRVAGEVLPGAPAGTVPPAGVAMRVFTGSALPDEGVVLVMIEDTTSEDGDVILGRAPDARAVRPRGSQARAGDVLMNAGETLHAGACALLASVGAVSPAVSPRLRVAHLSTGSELVGAEEIPPSGCIRDSNAPLIAVLVAEAGAQLVIQRRVSEDIAATVAAFERVEADVYLVSGGASVGAHDGTARALERLGFSIRSQKVQSRPGKPLIFATRGGQAAFGLPGNPLSHFVCFHLFVQRALDALSGRVPRAMIAVAIDGETPPRDPRETWWPARVRARDGRLLARALPWRDSSDLTGLPRANALLRIPADAEIELADALIFGSLNP